VGLCDQWCQVIICGNGTIDPGEQCEPPNTPTCDYTCQAKNCGDGVVDPRNEECEPPNTTTCDSLCYFTHSCGNGVVDWSWGEECEPPGTATCDASCKFIHVCGNGVIEPGEECDGEAVCGPDCTFARTACCEFGGGPIGPACFGSTVFNDFDAYFNIFKPCVQILAGSGAFGVCEGDPCPEPAPPELNCRLGSCTDQPIEPLPLCCQQAAGGCRETVATTAGGISTFGCSSFPPPDQGNVDRVMIGSCGKDGVCVPAN
jgi:hypothetical protein